MKCTRGTLGLFLLILTIIMAAFVLLQLPDSTNAETRGPQADYSGSGDWIINTTGNYIIDETVMFKMIPPVGEGDPSFVTYDESVEVKGNLIIEEGGELTLINASLSFNDEGGSGFHIEVHGNLTMIASGDSWVNSNDEATSSNNSKLRVMTGGAPDFEPSAPLLDYLKVTGSLVMEGEIACGVDHMNMDSGTIIVESAQRFDAWNLASSHYEISDSYANITSGSVYSASEEEDEHLIDISDSVVNFQSCSVISNGTVGVWITDSQVHFNSTHFQVAFTLPSYRNYFTKGIYAMDSIVRITNSSFRDYQDYAVRTRGDTEFYLSDCSFKKMNYGAEPDNNPLFDFQGSYHEMKDSQFSSKNTGIIVKGSDEAVVRLENVFFYNITGDVIHYDGTGRLEMEQCTIAHVVGNVVVVTAAQEVLIKDNNFSYTREWDRIGGGYVVKNIKGKAVVLEDVESLTISGNLFRMTEDRALSLDSCSDGNITGNDFHKLGYEATGTLHGIFLDRSYVLIENNQFNGSALQGGFEIFVVGYGGEDEDMPLDWDAIKVNNQFNESIPNKFAQCWELLIRTIDVNTNPLNQVPVNIDSMVDPAEELWSDHLGRIGPYYVFDYTITGQDNLTDYDSYTVTASVVRDNITFTTGTSLVPNSHQQLELILNTLTLDKKLDISEPDSGKVLTNFTATLTFHVNNHGNGLIYQNFLVFFRMYGEDDWLLLDEFRLAVEKGDRDYNYIWSDSLEPGDYDFKVCFTENITADPSTTQVEKNRVLTVFARPTMDFDTKEDTMGAGKTFSLLGWAIDPQNDDIIQVEIAIKRGEENGTVEATLTKMSGYWQWEYVLDTTTFLNGEYIVWARARNSVSFDEFAYSEWESLTFKIVNIPTMVLTGTVPDLSQTGHTVMDDSKGSSVLITGLIRDLYNNTHIMERVDVIIDGTLVRTGTLRVNLYPSASSWSFTWIDYQDFADGPHDFEIVAYYDNGEELVALPSLYKTIVIDSNRAGTDPVVIMGEKIMTAEGNYIFSGTASDDWQLTGLEYRVGNGGLWKELVPMVEGTSELAWDFQLEYTELMVGANYIYVKASDDFTYTENYTIFSFAYRYDLEVMGISTPVGEQSARRNFTVTATVRNNGPHKTPENVVVQFYVGSIQKELFVSQNPGQVREYEFTFNLADGGSHMARAVVNPGMMEMETNNSNNELVASEEIVVKAVSGTGTEDDDEGSFLEGSTIFIAVGILVVLLLISAVAFYSMSASPKTQTAPGYKQIQQSAPLKGPGSQTPLQEKPVIGSATSKHTVDPKDLEKMSQAPKLPGMEERIPPKLPELIEKKD